MAENTDIALRSAIIYSVYVRSHTEEGTFRAVIPDLDRIRALGTDIVWFLPIHPIGVEGKKGSLGCPYANRDYRSVNPCYGTLEDFRELVSAIHARGMKCMIDVVYNHTSPDAVLTKEHPEFYYRKPDGSFGGKMAEWSDIIDLDYDNPALWDYQIESLKYWASIVDGFRCDACTLIPAEFWARARREVSEVNPDCIWLGETIHASFIHENRLRGIYSATDCELFRTFDMEYEYDIRDMFEKYLNGTVPLSHYLDFVELQESQYPENYIKLRCLENHDRERIASRVKGERARRNFHAFLYFLKGSTLLYAGEEFENEHLPSLFEREPIDRNTGKDISAFLTRLAGVKKTVLSPKDCIFCSADDGKDIALLTRNDGQSAKYGIFSLKGLEADTAAPMEDGSYLEVLSGSTVCVRGGVLHCSGEPMLLIPQK